MRGSGTLVPEDIRWIPATTQGRVERILLFPGTAVTADTVILELVNPQLDQELQDAALKVQAAEAALVNLRVQAQNDYLQQKATAANISAELQQGEDAGGDERVARQGAARVRSGAPAVEDGRRAARPSATRSRRQQLAGYEESIKPRIAVQQSQVDQARAVMRLKQRQRDDLQGARRPRRDSAARARSKSASRSRPARTSRASRIPGRLKAEIKIAETQAKDIQIGQKVERRHAQRHRRRASSRASIRPCRTARSPWTSALVGDLPRGAVPDLSVDGTIELERLADVVFVGRPAFGQEQSTGQAVQGRQPTAARRRVQVKLGRSLGEHGRNPVRTERRRPGRVVRHVHVGRVRSRPPSDREPTGMNDQRTAAGHQARGAHKVFSTDEVETHALSEVSLEIARGEYVSIGGPSGCGKSTLLSILGPARLADRRLVSS